MSEPDLAVQLVVAAPVATVWDLVADPTTMHRFSPEAVAQRWLPPSTGPAVGARFAGRNRNGIHRWSTRCTLVRWEPGTALAWDVAYSPAGPRRGGPSLAVARWQLALTPDGPARTVVTQSFWDHRGIVMKVLGVVGRGVADVLTHNRATMERTLTALDAAAQRAAAG